MLRRLHPDQPESFAFTPANRAWADAQITKYPEGRQASAIIPLLWRAQEQEGWLTRPAIEHVCDMLGMAHIRGLEVATFYFMFQARPRGLGRPYPDLRHHVVHDLRGGGPRGGLQGQDRQAPASVERGWQVFVAEEVECLGACANAPMAQIGKDYYEDLTAEKLGWLLDEMAAGRVPTPGPAERALCLRNRRAA